MFPSLLPHTTRSTIETAPKLDNFYNSVDRGKKNPQNQILNWKNYKVEPYGQNKQKNKHKKWEN